MKKLIILAVALFVATGVMAQLNPMEPIPADKDVRVGKLPNGMTYYIRHNEKPKGQADFYIHSDVGAIQEADDQQGLAHFLEHMAFNGLRSLPGKTMIEYLEKIGVKFGYNLNAGTGWDQTQYLIKDVPTLREGVVDSALLILHDWSHFIEARAEEVESERGVIMEELRTRDGADWRSTVAMIKALGKGTQYEHRNLIGYLDGLKSFKRESLLNFYKEWYRPDYQALVIVGDVDVDAVENKIKALMSDVPAAAADAPQKAVITVPDNAEPIVSIFTDPEMQQSTVQIFIKHPALPKQANNLVYAEMVDVMTSYFSTMANARLQELAMKPDAPFLGAQMGYGSLGICPTLDCTMLYAQAQDGKLAQGIEAIYTEAEKIRRNGFTQSEFERAQNDLMRRTERKYTNRNDRRNGDYVKVYLQNFAKNTPMPDAETEWKLDSTLLKSISVADINALCAQIITTTNQVVVINAPEKEGVATPSEADVLGILKKVGEMELAAYEDNAIKEPLIAENVVLKGSPVKTVKENAVFGTTEWTLKNGIKVIVKPSKLKADEVLLSVSSNGGTSILTDEEFNTGMLMSSINSMSGVSKFSTTDLRKMLSGKAVSVSTSVNGYKNGMSGNCSPKDVETMLQLVYLNFTAPRFDQNDFNTVMKQYMAYVENLKTDPNYTAQEHLVKAIYNNNPRRQQLSKELLEGVKFEMLPTIYKKLYPNANSFTFTFVGNVDLATLRPLVEKYIGSLPTTKAKLNYVDDNVRPVKGEVIDDFTTVMKQPKVGVNFYFSGNMPYTIENNMTLSFLTQALDNRYLTAIREEKGGTYGVSVNGSLDNEPEQSYDMIISFDTNEKQADELCEIVMDEIKKIAENGPEKEQVEKSREFMLKNLSNTLEQNKGWAAYISKFYNYGWDYVSNGKSIISNISADDVKNMAKKILDDGNKVFVVMRPEAAPAVEKAE